MSSISSYQHKKSLPLAEHADYSHQPEYHLECPNPDEDASPRGVGVLSEEAVLVEIHDEEDTDCKHAHTKGLCVCVCVCGRE